MSEKVKRVAVLGLGGFVSGPGGLAAWLTRRPLLIHEQNAVAGTTNLILARFAQRIFGAFPQSFPATVDAELIGNPVRHSILALPIPSERFASRVDSDTALRVLVLGGSQGARQINEAMMDAIARLDASALEIFHQTGPADRERVADAYAKAGVSAEVVAFEPDMPRRYRWADSAVCRAGALTVAELALAALPALLVPYRQEER